MVDGHLIASSLHDIECVNDNYFEMYDDNKNELKLYHINHTKNKCELVNENYYSYAYEKNILVEYDEKRKKIVITNMDIEEKYEFTFNGLFDLQFENVLIYNTDFDDKFFISITFSETIEYFNLFDINSKKFMFENFYQGEVYDVQEFKGNLYIITSKNELIDEKGKILIDSSYDDINFHENLPYIFLEKNKKYGLAHLEDGKIIFETEYDEIVEEDDEFKAVSKSYITYKIESE